MASRTSRTSVLRGRPPGYTGMSGSAKAHCSSVTSLGYLWLRIPITYENNPYGTVTQHFQGVFLGHGCYPVPARAVWFYAPKNFPSSNFLGHGITAPPAP